MDALAIRELLHHQPFQPFILHLADGRAFDVPHTDFISISRNGRRVIVEKDDNSFEIIDVLLMNGVEVSPPPRLPEQGWTSSNRLRIVPVWISS